MRSLLSRLGPAHLALGTAAYWLGLAALKLTEPLLTGWRLSQLPPGQGSIEAGFANSVFHLTMTQAGSTVWAGSIGLGSLLLWLCGPPALLIGAWWIQREGETESRMAALGSEETRSALPPPGLGLNDPSTIQ